LRAPGPAIRAISHILDTHHADGTAAGLLEFAGLVAGTAFLGITFRQSMIAQRQTGR
jgi:hypothetical protein